MSVFNFFKKVHKRQAFRTKVRFEVTIKPVKVTEPKAWVQASYMAYAKDISEKGIKVETDAPIHKKDNLTLDFSLQKTSKPLHVNAVVRYVGPNASDGIGKLEVGLEFVNSPETVKYLKAVLALYK